MKTLHYYSARGATLRNSARKELNNETLTRLAPSVFANEAHVSRSAKYSQIPTIEVVDALRDSGWLPVAAREQRVRNEARRGFQKHELRFALQASLTGDDLHVGDSLVEMVLVNSSDGSSSYQLQAGIYRPVCANGMIVCESMFSKVSVRHVGFDPQDVIDVTAEVIESAPTIANSVEKFQQTALPEPVAEAFAREALMLRYGLESPDEIATSAPIDADKLLTARRSADTGQDLWSTFNRIQENVIKGGQKDWRKRKPNGKRFTQTRAVKGIDQDQKLNKALFRIAEVIAEQLN